jgi:hypothetical protein
MNVRHLRAVTSGMPVDCNLLHRWKSFLQVLEVCLDHVAGTMAERVRDLEEDSSSALEKLATKVNAHHLELVRRVKNRMVRLATRVETIRGLLEKYLGDDADLAELHLTGQRCGLAFPWKFTCICTVDIHHFACTFSEPDIPRPRISGQPL